MLYGTVSKALLVRRASRPACQSAAGCSVSINGVKQCVKHRVKRVVFNTYVPIINIARLQEATVKLLSLLLLLVLLLPRSLLLLLLLPPLLLLLQVGPACIVGEDCVIGDRAA